MRIFLQRLLKFAAYAAAGVVILLAIAVGLFRLLLPRLPEYQDEIKAWASAAIGVQVEFTGMDARWGLRGPELKFYGAELIRPDNDIRLVAAREVGVGVSLMRLMIDRTLVVDTVTIADTSVELRRTVDGSWQIQGVPLEELLDRQPQAATGSVTIIGENIELNVIRTGDERPAAFAISRLLAERDDVRIAIDANMRLPETVGRQMQVSVTHVYAAGRSTPWDVMVESDDLLLAGISDLLPEDVHRVTAGSGDLNASFAIAGNRIVSASGDLDFEGVTPADRGPFDIRGHLAYSNSAEGWLVAADDLVLRTGAGTWPESSLRFETSTDGDGEIVMFDAIASYLNLADATTLAPWLPAPKSTMLDRWDPDGIITNLQVTVSDLDTEAPRYSLSAELTRVGVAADGRRPGVRGFTGNLRADHDGGLVEIRSADTMLELPAWLNTPLPVDSAEGTVIWRRGNEKTTVLSDSIAISNAFIDSQTNIQIVFDGEQSPDVDLVSTWGITDIAAAKAYIPEPVMKPKLFLWFQDALVAGRMPRGETRFEGRLDRFPFADGSGRFIIEATVDNLDFRYARQFPLVNVSEMQVVLENTRLYTERNRSVSLGNRTVNANVEIADLRDPVLEIKSLSTGTLSTIKSFAAASPISRIFGGQLDRVTVAGNATLQLDLTVPLTDVGAYTFTARIVSNDGTVTVAGLNPPITNINGSVTIERETLYSESLGGRFLDEPVTLSLADAADDLPDYRAVVTVDGLTTAASLNRAFELPLDDQLNGAFAYSAQVLFPRAGTEQPAPLAVRVRSDLAGLNVNLPAPFGKRPDDAKDFNAALAFLPAGEGIRSSGQSAGEFAWDILFTRATDAWDFDRGVLTLGDAEMTDPDVRGLHIRGRTPEVRLNDWLALSRGEDARVDIAERIRSIDLVVDNLYLLGQHYRDQQVRVDRSARDWLVQLDGALLTGSVFVPYDFSADRALVLDMERLVLPGDDSIDAAERESTSPDPRSLPPISLRAGEFALGERYLGSVEAEFTRTPDGLTSDRILARDDSFEIVGNGSWLADPEDPQGSRSRLTATLTSSDVVATMNRLNYQPGIVSDDMNLLFDMSFSGGPSWDFLRTLDGTVTVRLGSGQLDDVEPGAGRMFGLMSIVALPRRLSLDFRDVFQKGFGFDSIQGSFRLEDGTAFTCNLSLEGPAADIGIIGRVDLVNRDYAQAAVVSANVGNTLPVVGALAAGPQAAAALFLFSQIFKKPLQDIGQVYYSVSGDWDEPAIESANAAQFAAIGKQAGCLNDSE